MGVASIDNDANNTIEPIDIKIEDMNFDSKDNNGSEDENAASNNLEHEIEPNSDDHSAILDGQQLLTPQNFARIASSTSEDISLDSLHYSVDNACEKQDPLSGTLYLYIEKKNIDVYYIFPQNTMTNWSFSP